MSRNIKGFTLIELLIGTAITGVLALSVSKMVYDAVTYRAKQYGVDESAETVRSVFNAMSIPVQTASGFWISPSKDHLVTNGFDGTGSDICSSFLLSGSSIMSATGTTGCDSIPAANHTPLTGDNIIINDFMVIPDDANPASINIVIDGKYQDSLGEHPFTEHTALTSKAL